MSDRGIRRTLIGQIVSDKMDKTVVVEVTRRFQHPVYKKYISRRKRYKAHTTKRRPYLGWVLLRD